MKIGLSEAAARKTLAAIPATTADPDLILVRERLEAGLAAVTGQGAMNLDELDALVTLVVSELNFPKHTHPDDQSCRPHLKTARPKLVMLLEKLAAGRG